MILIIKITIQKIKMIHTNNAKHILSAQLHLKTLKSRAMNVKKCIYAPGISDRILNKDIKLLYRIL